MDGSIVKRTASLRDTGCLEEEEAAAVLRTA